MSNEGPTVRSDEDGEHRSSGGRAKVVVGVDGSASSLRALWWAADMASLMGSPLEVVTAWTFPDHPAPLDVPVHIENLDHLIDEARSKLDRIIDDVIPPSQRAHVSAKVIKGDAARVLLDEAEGAALLVVGTRGRREMERLLLGSVSDRCVKQSHCPVTVVP
jgi:nucleotide-binding universal stress UspA family protein